MKQQYPLKFCYKGDRNYVHGTDIFTEILKVMSEIGYQEIQKVDFAFHNIAKTNLLLMPEYNDDSNHIKVTVKFEESGNIHRFVAIESGDEVTCRYKYFEEEIVKECDFDILDKAIRLQKMTNFSFIENIVAMNKALLEKLYDNARGKWYFTRLQLNNMSVGNSLEGNISLKLKSNFNFQLTKTAIEIEGKNVGFIYFSFVKKDQL